MTKSLKQRKSFIHKNFFIFVKNIFKNTFHQTKFSFGNKLFYLINFRKQKNKYFFSKKTLRTIKETRLIMVYCIKPAVKNEHGHMNLQDGSFRNFNEQHFFAGVWRRKEKHSP